MKKYSDWEPPPICKKCVQRDELNCRKLKLPVWKAYLKIGCTGPANGDSAQTLPGQRPSYGRTR